MFIVKKKIGKQEYYYLRASKRIKGKIKAINIAYLGKSRKEAEEKALKFYWEAENIEKIKNEEFDKTNMVEETKATKINVEELTNFCKREGFVFRSSEIYGGFAGFWDFGPLGIELFNNIKKEWWNYFVHQKNNMVGMEASIISHPRTWKASGHIANFGDWMVYCNKNKKYFRVDHLISEILKLNVEGKKKEELLHILKSDKDSFKKAGYDLQDEIKQLSLMFSTNVGPMEDETSKAYLRGETAQGMFMDFKLIQQTSRKQLPFGIAQIGRCFRNEIAPRDFLFRSREFHIGEFEFFINPEEQKCKLLTKEELSHYSSATFDIDYEYPFGSKEIAGIANRGTYDLNQHQKESKENLEIFDEKTNKKILPRVIEPTFGIERIFLALLTKAYTYDSKRENIILKIPPKLSPIKAAVFPIIKKPEFEKISEEIVHDLKKEFNVVYDRSGSIGRRYSRNDEIGTPY